MAAALPLEDPPAECVGLLRVLDWRAAGVAVPGEAHVLASRLAGYLPACSQYLVTTVASVSGTKSDKIGDPLRAGMPRPRLRPSTPTLAPERSPRPVGAIEPFQTHALNGLSPASGGLSPTEPPIRRRRTRGRHGVEPVVGWNHSSHERGIISASSRVTECPGSWQ